MMQVSFYCSCFYHVGSFKIGSLHPPGVWLRDHYVLFPPQFQFLFVMPSVVKGGGVVKKHVCSFF